MSQKDADECKIMRTDQRELNSQSRRNETTAAPINPQQSDDVLKLDKLEMDCCAEVFDYLAFKDLIAAGQTCKRLNQVVGHIFHRNFPTSPVFCEKDGIYVSKWHTTAKIKFFHEFIDKLHFHGNDGFKHLWNVQPKLHNVKQLVFVHTEFREGELKCLKEVFANVENMTLDCCKFDGNFDKSVLALCPNLKRLSLTQRKMSSSRFVKFFLGSLRIFQIDDSIIIGRGNQWLHQKYNKLEQFELQTDEKFTAIDELKTFLELNPNIRKLRINGPHIKRFMESWMRAKVQLDQLTLEIKFIDQDHCQLINALHQRGFYKRLRLQCNNPINQQKVDQLATLNELVELRFYNSEMCVHFSPLKSIEKLVIGANAAKCKDLMALPKLKAIKIYNPLSDDILPFIRESVELKRICINRLRDGIHYNRKTHIIDLTEMNKEREKLNGAQKITIYVQDSIYVATKLALNEIDLSLIRLKRELSHIWD